MATPASLGKIAADQHQRIRECQRRSKTPLPISIWAGTVSARIARGKPAHLSLSLTLAILVSDSGGHRRFLEHHVLHDAGADSGAVDRFGKPWIVGRLIELGMP